jgi:hypothetical protein
MSKSYARLRREAYPPIEMMVDALVKEGSIDPAVQAEGAAQKADYIAQCLAVKAANPKPGV